jgi:hypothetical protein
MEFDVYDYCTPELQKQLAAPRLALKDYQVSVSPALASCTIKFCFADMLALLLQLAGPRLALKDYLVSVSPAVTSCPDKLCFADILALLLCCLRKFAEGWLHVRVMGILAFQLASA